MVSVKTKSEQIRRIEELFAQLTHRFTAEDDAEQRWLAEHCSPGAARLVEELSVPTLHLLDAIPVDGSINIVGLSRATGIPKGTVSKTVRRLVAAGLLARHRLADNRKEVHLSPTDLGAEIQRAHRGLHEEMGHGIHAFLARYSAEELAVLTRVLADLHRMPREGPRFRPDLLD